MSKQTVKKILLALTFVIAWAGVIVVMYDALQNTKVSPSLTVANVLSYFTVESNILVGLFTGYLLWRKNTFSKTEQLFQLASLLYISITGIVYTTILASIWDPKGLTLLANNLLHYITPVLYVAYWLLFQGKRTMKYRNLLYVLIFPILYLIYSLIRGPITGFYPYPFIDASVLSTLQITINAVGVTGLFMSVGAILIFINNLYTSKQPVK